MTRQHRSLVPPGYRAPGWTGKRHAGCDAYPRGRNGPDPVCKVNLPPRALGHFRLPKQRQQEQLDPEPDSRTGCNSLQVAKHDPDLFGAQRPVAWLEPGNRAQRHMVPAHPDGTQSKRHHYRYHQILLLLPA